MNSRAKGANGERELARLIDDHLGVRLIRNLEQTRSGGHDLIVHPDENGPVADLLRDLAIECKRYQRTTQATLSGFWVQTVDQAAEAGKHPVLAFREDRQPWRIVLPLRLLNDTLPAGAELEWTATLSVAAFCAVVREIA